MVTAKSSIHSEQVQCTINVKETEAEKKYVSINASVTVQKLERYVSRRGVSNVIEETEACITRLCITEVLHLLHASHGFYVLVQLKQDCF